MTDQSTSEAPQPGQPLAALNEAAVAVRRTLETVDDDRWTASTPCSEWDVRQLVEHLVGGNALFAAAAIPGGSSPDGDTDGPGDSPLTRFDASIEQLNRGYGAEGALERPVTVPFGTVPGAVAVHLRTVELLVHGWDLARAVDQPFHPADDVVVAELAFTRPMLARVPDGRSPFGKPQPVPEDAPPLDQLVGLLGRTPSTRAS